MTDPRDLIQRLLLLAEQAVSEALVLEFEDPEERYIWRELQELKQLAEEADRVKAKPVSLTQDQGLSKDRAV